LGHCLLLGVGHGLRLPFCCPSWSPRKRDLLGDVGEQGRGLKGLIDPSTGGSGFDLNQVSNSYAGWKYDVGPSLVDLTHIAFVNFVYDLPILKNSSNLWAKRLIGGWQVSGVVKVRIW
jgi:hypothetical protein